MAEQLQNFGETTLNEALDASETGVDVTDGSVFPATGNYRVLVDDEIMKVTSRATNTLTVERGAEGTTAATHSDGADIKLVLTAEGLTTAITEVGAFTPRGDDYEFAYTESTTADVSVTATTEAGADTVITADAVTFDGSTEVIIDASLYSVAPPESLTAYAVLVLYDGSTSLGALAVSRTTADADALRDSLVLTKRLTPSAGSHTYSIRAYVSTGTAHVYSGAGGSGNSAPSFIRITRANPTVNGWTSGVSVGAKASEEDTQSIPNSTSTDVTLGDEDWDTDGFHSTPTDEFTIPAGLGGKYLITGGCEFATNGSGYRQSLVRVNGTNVATLDRDSDPSSAVPARCYGSTVLDLGAGDVVTLGAHQTSGGALNVGNPGAGASYLSLHLLGSGTVGETIGAKAYNSGTQAIGSSSETGLTLDTNVWDSDGFHSTVTNTSRFTIPPGLGGKYLLTARTYDGSSTDTVFLRLRVDGGEAFAAVKASVTSGGGHTLHLSEVVDLDAGQYIEAAIYQTSGVSHNYGHASARRVQTEVSLILLATQGNNVIERNAAVPAIRATGTLTGAIDNLTSGAWNDITFDTVEYDSHNMLNTSTGVFTIPEDGEYTIEGVIGLDGGNTTDTYGLVANINSGAKTKWLQRGHGSNTYDTRPFSLPVTLEKDDTVKLQVNPGASNIDVVVAQTRMSITKVPGPGSAIGNDLELDYTQKTTDTTVNGNTEGSATTIITGGSFTVDGSTPVIVEVFSPYLDFDTTGSQFINTVLTDGGTVVTRMSSARQNDSGSIVTGERHILYARYRYTPTSGSHTLDVRGWVGSGSVTVRGGSSGSGNFSPAFIRVTRANPIVNGGGGGLAEGTSFPTSPSTGDRFRRTDLDYGVYFYDGTRWLSEQLHELTFACDAQSTTVGFNRIAHLPSEGTSDMWLVRMRAHSHVSTTNNASNYWGLRLRKVESSAAATAIVEPKTDGDTAGQFTNHETTIGALVDVSTYPGMNMYAQKYGSPGALISGVVVEYRRVAT